MIAAGLLDEVERLLDAGLRDALTATQAIGYKEFVPVIEDGADLDEARRRSSRRPGATRSASSRGSAPTRASIWIDVTDCQPTQTAEAAMLR